MMTREGWDLPKPHSTCQVRLDDDTVTTIRRHGCPSGPRLVLSHANGLAIDLYYPFWSLLENEFDLLVYDIRNHGWNEVGSKQNHNIPTLIHDHDLILETIYRVYGSKPTVGMFHSLSTLVSILSTSELYSALVLFDPPLCKPTASESEFDESAERTAAMVRRRSKTFRTKDEFTVLLTLAPAFSRVLSGVCSLMADTTLRRSSDGEGYELRCPREYEAQIAAYVRAFAPLLDLTLLSCPAKVIGADPTLPYAYLPSFELSLVSTVDYDFVPDATHFLQLEKPAECIALVREFLEKCDIS